MPQVTAIQPQKKKKDRLNIFLDNKFAFSLSCETVLENQLKINKTLGDLQIQKLLQKESLARLTNLALNFLSARPRSEKEISDYLTRKIAVYEDIKFSEAKQSFLTGQVIAKFKKYSYINDSEFAKWWVRSRINSKSKGTLQIKLELAQKGIDRQIIDDVLAGVDQGNLAKEVLGKKFGKWQSLPFLEKKKKAYAYLAARGFDFETIKEAFASFCEKS